VNAFKDDADGKWRFKIFKETVIEVSLRSWIGF